ncbi:MAG: CoA transferase [Rhodospirillales bacterium]|nr:CoA transferase [Alphaproteobacteria bacterium]MBL6948653.1 CoA transferase [Rhodospirillales bacterium]
MNEQKHTADRLGPLSRFTVLDLTRVRSGPTAVRQFADWGANVIKVEAPENLDASKGMGGVRDGPDYQNIHRNKRGITLNMKDPDGVAVFKRLVEKADVVVENFRPGVLDRLGIDYESLKAVNPAIVLTSISGFGQDGPYATRPGFDQIAQGMGGLMSITGLPGQGPVRAGIPVADLTAGMYAALGTMAALLEREQSGEGQWVQTSLLSAMISMLDFQAARWLMKGEVAPQAGNNHPTSIPTGVFKTTDGHINIAATGDAIWVRLCKVLGMPELAEREDFSTGPKRSENRDAVNAEIEKRTVKETSADLIEKLNEAGIPCGPIYSIDQVFSDPQVKHIKMEHPVEHAELGAFNVVGQAVRMSRYEPRTGMPTPDRGQHTDEILGEFDFTADEIAELRKRDVL